MKHYYNDNALLVYQVSSRNLLTPVAESLMKKFSFEEWSSEEIQTKMLYLFYDKSNSLMYDYCCASSLSSDTTVEKWKKTAESDEFLQSLKDVFIDFIDQGFIPSEFILCSLSIYSEIYFTYFVS